MLLPVEPLPVQVVHSGSVISQPSDAQNPSTSGPPTSRPSTSGLANGAVSDNFSDHFRLNVLVKSDGGRAKRHELVMIGSNTVKEVQVDGICRDFRFKSIFMSTAVLEMSLINSV